MTTVQEHNATTGEIVIRPMTVEETAQYETDKLAFAAIEQAKSEQAAAKQAVLDRLGLTAEEAALLLGGTN